MNNRQKYNSQFAFHVSMTTGLYTVDFDVVAIERPRRGC